MAIYFFSESTSFQLQEPAQQKTIAWVKQAIINEGFQPGDLNFIFCSDDHLLSVNKAHLNHDYYTDIITFNYNEGKTVSGDIFISTDRVKENAKTENQPFETELNRVMVHGVLHLCGYNDKTPEQQREMRAREDYYLTLQA